MLRKLPGSDGGDYTLAELIAPISWKANGEVRRVKYIIVGPHMLGTSLRRGETDLGINIAYVTDESLLDERTLDFAKASYVAVGFASVE